MLYYQVFGINKWYWFTPTYSEEDLRRMPALKGLDYPVRSDFDEQAL
jgi:palmitoyltransferase ZDHHC2/15/20